MKSLLTIMLFITGISLTGQVTSFDEMEFEPDSTKSIYKPTGKNYVVVKSKRGTSGVNKTPSADAILTAEVTEIVLVFSETNASDLAEREEANRERWENLLLTYPELFQFSTTYKNVCQCNANGDPEAFKKSQGFYIYINGEVPKVEEPKTEEPKVAASQPVAKPVETPAPKTTNTEEKKPEEKAPATPAKTEKAAEKEVAVADKTVAKKEEPVVKKTEPVKEPEPPAVEETKEEPVVSEPPKKVIAKKAVPVKARKAKDPKACRQPCYGYGDEDLIAFFKDNIKFSKKQKRKAKKWMANVRLQIHFDGTVKKAMVTGNEPDFNKLVEDVIKSMNNWNAAVKNGTAVKSEVRFTLKYDKETKSMKPGDFVMNPKGSPKCPCVSDSEIFD